jgi:CRP-like cAMP-binding protein
MSRVTSKERLIGSVSLFSSCTPAQIREIASLADEVSVEAGTVLVREGRPGLEFFAIAAGEASVTVDGREVAVLGPGSFFGEMALLDRGPRSATVTASTQMHLLVLEPRSFTALLEEAPPVSERIGAALARRIRAAERVAV